MNFCPPSSSQATGVINNQEECFIDNLSSGYNLDHYGLIAATIKELNIIEEIDKRLPVSQLKGANQYHIDLGS